MNGLSCAIIVVQSNPAQIMVQTDKFSFVEETTDIIPVCLFPCYILKGKTKAFAQLFVHQEADICFLMQTQEFHIHKKCHCNSPSNYLEDNCSHCLQANISLGFCESESHVSWCRFLRII